MDSDITVTRAPMKRTTKAAIGVAGVVATVGIALGATKVVKNVRAKRANTGTNQLREAVIGEGETK